MEKEEGYSEQYEQALQVAVIAHRRQTRKGSGFPYIVHPVHVSVILLRHGFSTRAAVVGLLHDVVEDQDYELAEIEAQFGSEIAHMVGVLSERKEDALGRKRPWDIRKQETVQKIRGATREVVAVKCADTLHNAHSFVEDLRREGAVVWEHFNRGPQSQLDYYHEILAVAQERLSDHPIVRELASAVNELSLVISETS